jgi:hypothetical protein
MNRLGNKESSADCGALGRRRLLLALAGTAVLSGCGWKPLYERPGASVNSGGAGASLAQVSIEPVEPSDSADPLHGSADRLYDGRSAQLLQNYLKEALNPYGAPSQPLYRLTIQLTQLTQAAASLGDGTVTREDLIMAAEFQLRDLDMANKAAAAAKSKNTKAKPPPPPDPNAPAPTAEELRKLRKTEDLGKGVILRDQTRITTSYDILREPYADLTSRRDAQQRAAEQIAMAIQTRLAAFLVK